MKQNYPFTITPFHLNKIQPSMAVTVGFLKHICIMIIPLVLHISEDLRITASLGIFVCCSSGMKEFDFPREDVEPL